LCEFEDKTGIGKFHVKQIFAILSWDQYFWDTIPNM